MCSDDRCGSGLPSDTPGYLGHIFDDFIDFSTTLKPLGSFDFSHYGEMADELGLAQRTLEIDFGSGRAQINFDACALNEIVEAMPSVEAIYDFPPDQGLASGSGYIFVLRSGFTAEQANAYAHSLRAILNDDYREIKAQYDAL